MLKMETIVNLALAWIKKNIKLPFNLDTVKEQAVNIGFNQGLPAVVESFESMVPEHLKDRLNHRMWQTTKDVVNQIDPKDAEGFVEKASQALHNSGQTDELLKHINQ